MKFNNVIQSIKKHEGLRLKPYKCPANKLTIGYGRNIEDNGISEDEAYFLLKNDIYRIEVNLTYSIVNKYNFSFRTLPDFVQDILIEMAYQLGVDGLFKFKKMFSALKNDNYDMASKEMLNSLWAKQTPKRAKTLSNLMKGGK